MAWKSTDCGATFKFLSVFDPAVVGDGTCAYPQGDPKSTSPGSPEKPVFDMGGTDGQLIHVDSQTGQLIMTHQCVGELGSTQSGHFTLDPSKPVDKTLIVVSNDGAASWVLAGAVPGRYWRANVASVSQGGLVFGLSTSIWSVRHNNNAYVFDSMATPIGDAPWGFSEQSFVENPKLTYTSPTIKNSQGNPDRCQYYVYANMWASTILTEIPGTDTMVLAYPSTVDTANYKGHGYQVYLISQDDVQRMEPPIVPKANTLNSFVIHLVAVTAGGGPVLLYWSEFNADTNTATVRGRLISAHGWSLSAFDLSRSAGQPRSWSITPGTVQDPSRPCAQTLAKTWYGDYQTASGYSTILGTGSILQRSVAHHYFPIWVEQDGGVRYTEMVVTEPLISVGVPRLSQSSVPDLRLTVIDPLKWIHKGPPVEVSAIPRSPAERSDVELYEERARVQRQQTR
jgi:hypothetical protein